MRKSTISHIALKSLWLLLALLPLIIMCICLAKNGNLDYFNTISYQFWSSNNNIIYTSLTSIFGTGGVIELFPSNSFMFSWMCYYVCLLIARLVLDVLMFIPRIAHSWLTDFIKTEDDI